MKILIAHRYFWPDQVNCGQILWHVAQHLQLKGHHVDIITSLPSRNYNSNKIQAKKIETVKAQPKRTMRMRVYVVVFESLVSLLYITRTLTLNTHQTATPSTVRTRST